MIDVALSFVRDHGPVVEEQSKYLKDNDWSVHKSRSDRIDNHRLHVKLLGGFVSKVKYIEDEAGSEFSTNKKLVAFTKKLVSAINLYVQRGKKYMETQRWQDYDNTDEVADEIEFQEDILKALLKKKEEVKAISITEEKKDVKLKTFGDVIFCIAQREELETIHPEIKEFVESRRK